MLTDSWKGFVYPKKFRLSEDGEDCVKTFYLADEDITLFVGVSTMKNEEINDKVKTTCMEMAVEDMFFKVRPGDNVAEVLAYRQ